MHRRETCFGKRFPYASTTQDVAVATYLSIPILLGMKAAGEDVRMNGCGIVALLVLGPPASALHLPIAFLQDTADVLGVADAPLNSARQENRSCPGAGDVKFGRQEAAGVESSTRARAEPSSSGDTLPP
jgi:hypothetical protein